MVLFLIAPMNIADGLKVFQGDIYGSQYGTPADSFSLVNRWGIISQE